MINLLDLGYLRVEADYPKQISILPNRKKITPEFSSTEEKEYNLEHTKRRIVIEYFMCRIKKYRILADIFRNILIK